jgi:NTP pyrophosphatase (non-canonical NTP hydrolase)
MMATSKTIGQMQLDDLVEGVNGIYSSKDARRSIWDVWMHANHHAAGVGEEVRKGDTHVLLEQIADCAMWLFTMVQKLQGPIGVPKSPDESPKERVIRVASTYSDMLWRRFPGMCPFCYWRRSAGEKQREQQPGFRDPCDCAPHSITSRGKDEKRLHTTALRAFSQGTDTPKPTGIDEWQTMFGAIFGASLRRLDLSQIALHLLEEMGEVSDALVRMYTYTDKTFPIEVPIRQVWLEAELSDVSSWLFAVVEKLGSEKNGPIGADRPLLSQIIWNRYGSDELQGFKCWKCHQPSCTCPIIFVPPDRPVEDMQAALDSARKAVIEC